MKSRISGHSRLTFVVTPDMAQLMRCGPEHATDRDVDLCRAHGGRRAALKHRAKASAVTYTTFEVSRTAGDYERVGQLEAVDLDAQVWAAGDRTVHLCV